LILNAKSLKSKITVGKKAPDFTLQDSEGKERSLTGLLQEEDVVVLFFFPLAFSGVCTRQMCTVRDNMKMYNSLGAMPVGISVDSFFTLKAFKKAQNLNFLLLSDFNKQTTAGYGVLNDDFYGMHGVAKRAVFVIGKDGIVNHREVMDDADNLPDIKGIVQAIKKG
jgi:glutaredoxin-dependent peroxiredoxin